MIKKITTAKEDFLKAMHYIRNEKGKVKPVDLARLLEVSKSSVTQMAQKLAKEELVRYKSYAGLQFTSRGAKIARRLTAKHRIIEVFLQKVLGITNANVHMEAHRLEHAFSDESIHKLYLLLRKPKRDPHDSLIPQIDFSTG